MTRDELAALIVQNLDDSGVFHTSVEVNDAIQDAFDDLILTHGLLPKAVAITETADLTFYDLVTLIPDFVALRGIYRASTKLWLVSRNLRWLHYQRDDWELQTGSPTDFWVANYRRVGLFPHSNVTTASNLWVFYYAAAPALTGSSDLNIPVDSGFRALENYATSVLLTKAEEWTKAEMYDRLMQEDAEECKLFRNRLILPDYVNGLRGLW